MSQKLNRELQNHSPPGHPEPGEGQGIMSFPTNMHAFHRYSEPIRSTLATMGPSTRIQHSHVYFASHMKSAKEKNNSDPTAFHSPSVISLCCCWVHVFFFFSLHKQCNLPLLLRKFLGESAKKKKKKGQRTELNIGHTVDIQFLQVD